MGQLMCIDQAALAKRTIHQLQDPEKWDLSSLHIGDYGVENGLIPMLKTDGLDVKVLDLRFNDLTGAALEALAPELGICSQLEALYLYGNTLGNTDQKGGLDDTAISALVHALVDNRACPRLKQLWLGQNDIGDVGAECLGRLLSHPSSHLTVLDLSSNLIGDEGAEHLARGLEDNSRLQELYLGWNYLSDEGSVKLAEMMEDNITLRCLQLVGNDIQDKRSKNMIREGILRNQEVECDLPDDDSKMEGVLYMVGTNNLTEVWVSALIEAATVQYQASLQSAPLTLLATPHL